MSRIINKLCTTALLVALTTSGVVCAQQQSDNSKKIKSLTTLIKRAKSKGIDTSREESTLWMANKFLEYAEWDEQNVEANRYQYSMYRGFKSEADKMARELPAYERREVYLMLESSIEELQEVIDGRRVRRAIPPIDWHDIKPVGGSFMSGGRPVFVNDYFTKTPELVNDYCGCVKGTTLNLGAINNLQGELSATGEAKIASAPNTYSGYVLLWHGAAPAWARSLFGDMSKGRRYFTHYDIDNPHVRELWDVTFKSTIPLLKGRTVTDLGYILANEPHWYSVDNSWFKGEVSHYTTEKFREWLKQRHGSIERLNELWGSEFKSFGSVEFTIPFSHKLIGTNACYDWQRFNMDRVTEWFEFLDSGIKKYDSLAKSQIKYMPHLFSDDHRDHGLDFERLVELTDISGNDAKITKKQINKLNESEYWEGRYSYDWREVALSFDFFRSVAPNKPILNSECHFISSSNYRSARLTTDFTNSTYWLAALHGQCVSLTWFWAREGSGIRRDLMKKWEHDGAMNSSYAASICTQPRVANQLSQTMMELTAFGKEMTALQQQRRPIRIFYSETSALRKSNHMSQLFKIYESLYFEGMPLGFATQRIMQREDNRDWDVVILASSEYLTDGEFAALQSYIDQGGVVVCDGVSGCYDEYGSRRTESLKSSGKGRLITSEDAAKCRDIALSIVKECGELPPLSITESNECDNKGCLWRVTPYEEGGYLLNIINLGASRATLNIEYNGAKIKSLRDLSSGAAMQSTIFVEPEKVLLLQVEIE